MLPGPTNVPNRVINAMLTPMINHRSDDFRKLYKDIISKTQTVFETENDIVVLTTSGTGAVEASESLIKKENGFSKIHELEPGVSPLHAIEVLDSKYPDKG